MSSLKITDIKTHILLSPNLNKNATSSAQDNLVVIIQTNDPTIFGIGESDANAWMLKVAIEAPTTHTMGQGLKEMLIGEDPMQDAEYLWDKLYTGSAMNGRRGLVIHAIGALDIALWDIKGKYLKKPCWQLLLNSDTPRQEFITPYASLQPNASNLDEYKTTMVEWVTTAKAYGFTAAKLECTFCGPYAHCNLNSNDSSSVTKIVAECRKAVGADFMLMVDVQYAYKQASTVIEMLLEWRRLNLNIFFIETPISMDETVEIKKLKDLIGKNNLGIKIAYGEWQATRFEFRELHAKIDICQPDVGRVGGLTEAFRVCQEAEKANKLIVPHCWNTGIGIAATAHLAAATTCKFIEFLPLGLSHSPIRRNLTFDEELVLEKGFLKVPMRPGLGINLNMDALRKLEAQ
eukprot:g7499.t1